MEVVMRLSVCWGFGCHLEEQTLADSETNAAVERFRQVNKDDRSTTPVCTCHNDHWPRGRSRHQELEEDVREPFRSPSDWLLLEIQDF
jgi:hypothetical protein